MSLAVSPQLFAARRKRPPPANRMSRWPFWGRLSWWWRCPRCLTRGSCVVVTVGWWSLVHGRMICPTPMTPAMNQLGTMTCRSTSSRWKRFQLPAVTGRVGFDHPQGLKKVARVGWVVLGWVGSGWVGSVGWSFGVDGQPWPAGQH